MPRIKKLNSDKSESWVKDLPVSSVYAYLNGLIPFIVEADTKINEESTGKRFDDLMKDEFFSSDVVTLPCVSDMLKTKSKKQIKLSKIEFKKAKALLSINPVDNTATFSCYMPGMAQITSKTPDILVIIEIDLSFQVTPGKMSAGKGRYYRAKGKLKPNFIIHKYNQDLISYK